MTRLHFRIEPGAGVGPVRLGATLEIITDALRELPGAMRGHSYVTYADKAWLRNLRKHGKAYFFDAALQVEFGEDRVAEHIGISGHPQLWCTLCDVDVFDTPAAEVFKHVAALEGVPDAAYDPSGGDFRRAGITLWEADEQYDYFGNETRPVYAQVGVRQPDDQAAPASDLP